MPGPANVIVCATGVGAATVKLRVTVAAGATLALPAWLASRLQVPTATRVSVVPLTVQTPAVVEASATARPALELATRAGAAVPSVWLASALNVMVCAVRATVNDCITEAAAA